MKSYLTIFILLTLLILSSSYNNLTKSGILIAERATGSGIGGIDGGPGAPGGIGGGK